MLKAVASRKLRPARWHASQSLVFDARATQQDMHVAHLFV